MREVVLEKPLIRHYLENMRDLSGLALIVKTIIFQDKVIEGW